MAGKFEESANQRVKELCKVLVDLGLLEKKYYDNFNKLYSVALPMLDAIDNIKLDADRTVTTEIISVAIPANGINKFNRQYKCKISENAIQKKSVIFSSMRSSENRLDVIWLILYDFANFYLQILKTKK